MIEVAGYKLGYNIILLLLQITLQRQQEILKNDPENMNEYELSKNPIVDEEILIEFKYHKMLQIFKMDGSIRELHHLKALPHDINKLNINDIKKIIHETFKLGILKDTGDTDDNIDILTLCEFYYDRRLEELKKTVLPDLKYQLESMEIY